MISTALSTGFLVVIWGSLLYRLHALGWRLRDAIQRANVATHLLIALTFLTLYPPVYLLIDRVVGVPNIARLIGNCFGVVGGWFFRPVVAQLERVTQRGRVQSVLDSVWLPILTMVTLTFLFNRAALPISAPLDFQTRYSTIPFMAPYRIVLMAYVALVAGRVFLLSLQNLAVIERNPQPYRRVQARLQLVGWALCVGYALQECVFIILALLGVVPQGAYPALLANICLGGGILCLLSNALFDAWHWIRQYRTHRRLYRLWRDLYDLDPNFALEPPRSRWADTFSFGDLGFQLYRRTIEIYDGLNALKPYVEASPPATSNPDASSAAVTIHAAMTAKRHGRLATHHNAVSLLPAVAEHEDERQALERVAVAYRRIVRSQANTAVVKDEVVL